MSARACLILLCYTAVHSWPIEPNHFQDFIEDQSNTMKSFFEAQKTRIESALNTGYEETLRMTNSVNDYLDNQTRKISADINSYVESAKSSGRKVMDSWSYLPVDEPGAQMDNPDLLLSVPAIITREGYTCETHTVISQGYLIEVHRIPRAKDGGKTSQKTVLLQHGLFASSADWILNGPEKGLAYVLADAGYDVWMSNIRGNKYAREHAKLKTGSKSFWNFSWHDVALHDIPAVIDYIIKVKGETEIAYIGHSMGTTILFAMLTLRPEYNRILKTGIALAPVAFLSDIKSPLKSLTSAASNMAYMKMLYGSHEFIPQKSVLATMSTRCETSDVDSKVCKNVVFYICGYNEKQFNKTLLPVFLANLGPGTSWKTVVHFAQEVESGGKFRQFDYGSNNMRVYNMDTPPEYDLSKITLPITLFWSENDLLSSEKDVTMLHEKIPSTDMYKVPDPEFNHIDYLWAIDAPTLVNIKVLEILEKSFSKESFTFSISLPGIGK